MPIARTESTNAMCLPRLQARWLQDLLRFAARRCMREWGPCHKVDRGPNLSLFDVAYGRPALIFGGAHHLRSAALASKLVVEMHSKVIPKSRRQPELDQEVRPLGTGLSGCREIRFTLMQPHVQSRGPLLGIGYSAAICLRRCTRRDPARSDTSPVGSLYCSLRWSVGFVLPSTRDPETLIPHWPSRSPLLLQGVTTKRNRVVHGPQPRGRSMRAMQTVREDKRGRLTLRLLTAKSGYSGVVISDRQGSAGADARR